MKFWLGLILLLFVIASCNENESVECTTPVTVRNLTGFDGCGFVFELESGHRLEPQVQYIASGDSSIPQPDPNDPLYDFDLYDGQKLLIAYRETNRPSICMVGPTVRVLCITEVGVQQQE